MQYAYLIHALLDVVIAVFSSYIAVRIVAKYFGTSRAEYSISIKHGNKVIDLAAPNAEDLDRQIKELLESPGS